jgi:hypothetical protein
MKSTKILAIGSAQTDAADSVMIYLLFSRPGKGGHEKFSYQP